jgi:hypothetical protein
MADVGNRSLDAASNFLLGQIELSAPFTNDLPKTLSVDFCDLFLPLTTA